MVQSEAMASKNIQIGMRWTPEELERVDALVPLIQELEEFSKIDRAVMFRRCVLRGLKAYEEDLGLTSRDRPKKRATKRTK